MNEPTCSYCGHYSHPDSEACEKCNLPLYGDASRARSHADAGSPPFDIPSPRFTGAGDVFGPTLELFRKHFPLVGLLALVTTLPVGLLQYASARLMTGAASDPRELSNDFYLSAGGSVLAWAVSLVGAALMEGALVYAVFDLQKFGRASAGECLWRGLKVLPKVFVVNLIYAVAVGVGYLMLIVPGVIFSVMLALAIPVAVAEGRGPVDSLQRSADLTKGYRWLLFLTFFLWGIGVVAVNMLVTWSFVYANRQGTFASVITEALISGILNSSSAVLTVYIYMGILKERGSAAARAREGGPAAR
jgi:Uncharacterised protein family (UPF0259)